MTPPQGALGIERMCALAGVSRASYYRHWRRASRLGENRPSCGMCSNASRSLTGTMATVASTRCYGARGGR